MFLFRIMNYNGFVSPVPVALGNLFLLTKLYPPSQLQIYFIILFALLVILWPRLGFGLGLGLGRVRVMVRPRLRLGLGLRLALAFGLGLGLVLHVALELGLGLKCIFIIVNCLAMRSMNRFLPLSAIGRA